MTLIEKLVLNEKITNEEVEEELVKICEKTLPKCGEKCPVYKMNDNNIVNSNIFYEIPDSCECLKNGHKMRMFIIFKNRENKKNLIESEK